MAGKRSIDVSHTWPVYPTLVSDHFEAVNAAPMTIRTYGIAVRLLGEFLEAQGTPANLETVTREMLVGWMRFLRRPKSEGGQGLAPRRRCSASAAPTASLPSWPR